MAIQRVNPGKLQELLNQWIQILDPTWLVEITETESEFIIKKNFRKRQLSELKGLGKELWQKVDVEEYLDEERNSWETMLTYSSQMIENGRKSRRSMS